MKLSIWYTPVFTFDEYLCFTCATKRVIAGGRVDSVIREDDDTTCRDCTAAQLADEKAFEDKHKPNRK